MFGIRVAGTFVDTDSYIKNVLPAGLNTSSAGGASGLNFNSGRSPGGWKNWGVRASMRYAPNDSVDLRLKGYAGKSKGTSETNIPYGQSRTDDTIDYTNPNFLLSGLFQSLAPAGLLPANYSRSARGIGKMEVEADTLRPAFTRAKGVVFSADVKLSDRLSVISISGYDDGRYRNFQDCDGAPLSLCAIGYDSKFKAFNQDVRFNYDGDRFDMIFGLYYGHDSLVSNNEPNFFNFLRDVNAALGSPTGYFNPGGAFNGAALSAASLPTGITATQHFKQVRKSYAIYGEGSYEVTPTVKITAGLRYTIDKNAFKEGFATYFDDTGEARMLTVSDFNDPVLGGTYFIEPVYDELGNVVIPSYRDLGVATPGGLERRGKSKKFSGRVILDWKPVDGAMFYASYSRGYRAGTFNGLAYGSSNQVYFVRPEEVNAYEVGFKTRFMDNRIQINGAFFYYDYKGQQGQVVDNTATANLISLDGNIKGLELDVQFAATERLKLNAALGLLDSKYKNYDQAACAALSLAGQFPAQDGSCVQSSGGNVSVGGNPFPYAAKSSLNLGFDWDAVDIGSGVLRLHGDAAYTGRFYFDAFKDYSRGPLPNVSTGRFSEGSGKYWVTNARVTYDAGSYSISLWGKNLMDKTYYPFAIALENLFGNGHLVRAEPRTYGIEASVKF